MITPITDAMNVTSLKRRALIGSSARPKLLEMSSTLGSATGGLRYHSSLDDAGGHTRSRGRLDSFQTLDVSIEPLSDRKNTVLLDMRIRCTALFLTDIRYFGAKWLYFAKGLALAIWWSRSRRKKKQKRYAFLIFENHRPITSLAPLQPEEESVILN